MNVRVSALCLLLAPTVSSTGAAETVADTKFSVNRGFYVIPFRVKISSVTPDAEIRYTTDGSEPALNHGSGGPSPQLVEVTTTTVLRAKAFREGLEPTNVDTQTYLFTNHVLEQPDEIPGYPSLVMRTKPPDITVPNTDGSVRKVYVDGVAATIVAERVEYLDENGKLVTESLRDFTKKALRKHFASLDDFLKRWKAAERKQAIVEELEAEGLPLDLIALELGKDLDPFDLICHVAFDAKPLTRRERADNVKKRNVFNKYGDQARAVLDALLAKYADEGVFNLDDITVLRIPPFTQLGTPVQLIEVFGGREGFVEAVHELQSALYRETA